MAHDTHGHPKENKTIISFKNSFWLVIIIVGLFIAALNFVKAEGGGEEGPARPKVEEAAAPANEKSAGEVRSETKTQVPSPSETAAPAADTAKAK